MSLINADLLRKYNVPTPRYTSYPTALAFEPMDALPDSNTAPDEPVALYFHLPFCRSLCWYCACTRVITRRQAKSGLYLERLFAELDSRLDRLGTRPVVQVHLGGGTPTFFQAEELEALARYVHERLNVARDAEFSVEIDPRELHEEQIDALARSGFNRASLGVQDHDPRVQKAIHRDQPWEQTARAVRELRSAGIRNINFDLIYGLPFQSVESFGKTIDDVLTLAPDRLAVYSYAHVPWAAPAQKLVVRDTELPDANEKIGMFLAAADILESEGYTHIGMDHFAVAEDALTTALADGTLRRNFMGYTTRRGVDIHAFGMSAISQTGDAYFQNHRELGPWEAAVDSGLAPVVRGYVLDRDDQLRRDLIMQIMCSNQVDFAELGEAWDVDAPAYFATELDELSSLVDDGLVDVDEHRLRVTRRGRFLVRNIASVFDATRRGQSRYSRAI